MACRDMREGETGQDTVLEDRQRNREGGSILIKGLQIPSQDSPLQLYGDRPDVDSASTMTKWSLDDGNEIKQSWTCGGTIQFDYYVREDGKDNYKMRVSLNNRTLALGIWKANTA